MISVRTGETTNHVSDGGQYGYQRAPVLGARWLVGVLCLLLLAGGCAARVTVSTASGADVDWSKYRSFAMGLPNTPVPTENIEIDPFTQQRLRQLTYLGLRSMGLRPVSRTEASLVVAVIAGKEERMVVHHLGGDSHDSIYGPTTRSDYVQAIEERIVVIDLISSSEQSVLWRGSGVLAIHSTFGEAEYRELVHSILRKCPLYNVSGITDE